MHHENRRIIRKRKDRFLLRGIPPQEDQPGGQHLQDPGRAQGHPPRLHQRHLRRGRLQQCEPVHGGDRLHHPEPVPHHRHGPSHLRRLHQGGGHRDPGPAEKQRGGERASPAWGPEPGLPAQGGFSSRRRAGLLHPPPGGLRRVRRLLSRGAPGEPRPDHRRALSEAEGGHGGPAPGEPAVL